MKHSYFFIKRISAFAIVLAMVVSLILPGMPALSVKAEVEPLADQLQAHYTFDDPSDLGRDSSGKGNHATPVGNLTGTQGIRNGAASFNGTGGNQDAYFEIPAQITHSANLTVMTWAKFDRATIGGWARIFEFKNNDLYMSLFANHGSNWSGYRADCFLPGGSVTVPREGSRDVNGVALPAVGEIAWVGNQWHHVAFVMEGYELRLYINGQLVGTNTSTHTPVDINAALGCIGRTMGWGDASYIGLMDDFRVYSQALTAQQIASVNGFAPEDFLILDLDFENASNPVADASGYNVWTNVESGALDVVAGKNGNGVYFDGNDAVRLQGELLYGNQGTTVAAWMKFDELPPAWSYLYTFSFEGLRTYAGMSLAGHGAGPSVVADVGNGQQGVINNTAVPTNQWVHIAMTMESGKTCIYMNGVQVAQSDAIAFDTADLGWTDYNYIGRGIWNDADPKLKGYMDDFRVYSRVLTAEQILDIAGIDPEDANKDLLAHYTFDDPLDLGKDASGNGNHATEVGDVTSTDGIRNGAASFNGTAAGTVDSHFTIPAALTHRENLTFMTWAKFDRNDLNGWSRLLEFWNEGNGYFHLMADCGNQWDGLWAKYTTAAGEWGVPNGASYDYEGTGLWLPSNGDLAYANGAWNHIAVVAEGNTLRLYINGHLASTKTGTCSPKDIAATVAVLGDGLHEGDKNYQGLMDDVRIYGAALTAQQIAQVNGFQAEDFLLLELNFDDETNLIKDTGGNDIWTENTDGQLTAVEGVHGTAAYFDGTDSIRLADGILYGCEGMTVTAWVKSTGAPQSWQYLYSFANQYHSRYTGLSLTGHGVGPSVFFAENGIPSQIVVANSTGMPADEWTHIAATVDADVVSVYVNGVQVAQSKSVGMDASEMGWTVMNYIGKGTWNENDPWLTAAVDDFRIYSRSLSQSEILEESEIIVPGLKNIYLDGTALLGFNSAHTRYNQILPVGATQLPQITVESFNKSSQVEIQKPASLPGDAVITCTEENGVKTVYTITFTPLQVEADALQQLTLEQIQVEDDFWSPKLELFQSVMVRDLLKKWDEGENAFANFDLVAAGERNTGNFIGGTPWRDSDVYRVIAGASDMLISNPDEELEELLRGYIDRICAACESTPDGYMICYNLLNTDNKRFDEHDNVWTHNAFQFGHLVRAAINWYKATGETRFLRAATRFANHVSSTYGEGKINMVPAHSEPEEFVLMLYHLYQDEPELKNDENLKDLTINEQDYLDLVEFWVDNRGNHEGRVLNANYGVYAQDHALYYDQLEPAGHAVRANLFYNAIALMGREKNGEDTSYLNSAMTLWDTITRTQMYLTGATGSSAEQEKYGGEYDLPNDGYCETCAAMSMGTFSKALGLALADGKYMDILELELYNGALGGVGANGNTYFYENPLSSTFAARWSWHGCPCCPDMFVGWISRVPEMIYAYTGSDVYVNQYIGSTANIPLAGGTLVLKQEADWAWSGTSRLTVVSGGSNLATLRLRLPQWSANTVIKVNGQEVNYASGNGYAVLTKAWADGDTVEIAADMTPQREYSNPNVVYNVDRVALRRGPMIYCLEGVDNQVDGLDITRYAVLPTDSAITLDQIPDLYGGVVSMKMEGNYVKEDRSIGATTLTAVPFYARANRVNGSVNVWIAEDAAVIPAYPATVVGEKTVVTFDSADDLSQFDLYSNAENIAFAVNNGQLDASEGAELKAIWKNHTDLSEVDVSVDVHVDGDGYGNISGGIYLLAANAGNNLDQISAYNVHLDSVRGSNDLHVNVYKFDAQSGYQGSIASTTLAGFFQANMPKYDVNLRAVLKDGNIDVYVNNSATPYLEDVLTPALTVGSVGIRAYNSDISFNNFTVTVPGGSDEPQKEGSAFTVDFNEPVDSELFDFYSSSNGGYGVSDGKLIPTGDAGEFKAIYKDNGQPVQSVSVELYPNGESGMINGGLYINASEPGNNQDQINALYVGIESFFTGWDDAANRLDLIVGSFSGWTEHARVISETGSGNNLFTGGVKEPVTLRADIRGSRVTATVSLVRDPSKYVSITYVVSGADLSLGKVGIRSQLSDVQYDNFTVVSDALAEEDVVATVGGRSFASVSKAAEVAGSQTVCVVKNTDEAITISSNVTVDLVGNTLTNVTVSEGATLTLMDSATDDYKGECGSATVSGIVAGGKNYLLASEGGVYSAHRYDIAITYVSLKPADDALGYKAQLFGDAIVQSQVESIGFNLWVTEDNVKSFSKPNANAVTLRLKNILACNGGQVPVYAEAVVTFANGQTDKSDAYSTTMKDTLQTVNAGWADYSVEQQNAVKALCDKYAATKNWELTNIYPAEEITPAA